jgi:hypothetical protein
MSTNYGLVRDNISLYNYTTAGTWSLDTNQPIGSKAALIGFLNFGTQLAWANTLNQIQLDHGGDILVVAVLFKTDGTTVTDADMLTFTPPNIPLLYDLAWGMGSLAQAFRAGFTESGYGGGYGGTDAWFYLVDANRNITDKWNLGTTNAKPLSFYNFGAFIPTDTALTQACVEQRVLNLKAKAKIIAADPIAGTAINGTKPVILTFSKPLNTATVVAANFGLSGGGAGTLALNGDPSYVAPGKINDKMVISFQGAPDDTQADKNIILTASPTVHDWGGQSPDPAGSSVTYLADVTVPAVISPDPAAQAYINSSIYYPAQTVVPIEVLFSEPAYKADGSALDSTNFGITNVAGLLSAPAITNVAPASSSCTLQIQLPDPPGNGTFTLTIQGVADLVGNAWAAAVGINFTVDIVNPPMVIPDPVAGSPVNGAKNLTLEIDTCAAAQVWIDSLAKLNLPVGSSPVSVRFDALPGWPTIPDGSTFLVSLSGVDAAGNIGTTTRTFLKDVSGPYVAGATLDLQNLWLDVTFSEPVYGGGGSGAVPLGAFSLTFAQNAGSATGATITSISKDDSSALAGGETVVRFHLDITGIPSGLETIKITITTAASVCDLAGNPATGTLSTGVINLFDQRPPVLERDAYLVLDFSSSMSDTVTVSGVTVPKVDLLKQAVAAILTVWKDATQVPNHDNDKVGIARFDSNSYEKQSLTLLANTDVNVISGELPSGCTAMGSGLARALIGLYYKTSDSTRKRCVILITDGIQNINPMVYYLNPSAPSPAILIDVISSAQLPPSSFFCSSTVAALPGTPADIPYIVRSNGTQPSDNLVPIHTMGIGDQSGFEQMLKDISGLTYDPATFDPAAYDASNLGLHFEETDLWPDLESFFGNILVHLFKGASLEIVKSARGSVAPAARTTLTDFDLTASVRYLSVLVSWPQDAEVKVSLKKGNATVRSQVVTGTKHFAVLSLTLPSHVYRIDRDVSIPITAAEMRKLGLEGVTDEPVDPSRLSRLAGMVTPTFHITGTLIEAAGNWRVEVECTSTSGQSLPLSCIVFADERSLDFDLAMPSTVFASARPLRMELRVLENGRPIKGNVDCRVGIVRPSVSPANVMARFSDKLGFAQAGKGDASGLGFMWKKLKQNKEAAAILARKISTSATLAPIPGAPGRYSLTLSDCSVAGCYTFSFDMEIKLSDGSRARRGITRTVSIVPAVATLKPTLACHFEEKEKKLYVLLAAVDQLGNVIGPRFGSQLQVLPKWEQKPFVHDLCTGSYAIVIGCSPENFKSGRMEIRLRGRPAWNGIVSSMPAMTARQWEYLSQALKYLGG